jgi:hypothetical protein
VKAASRAWALLAAALVAIVAASSARAQPAPEGQAAPFAVSQRRLGFGPSVGFLSGTGLTVGGGGDIVRGWFTGGFMPIVIFANTRTPERSPRLNYYSSWQINEDLAFHLLGRPRIEASLLAGYKYNSVLGHGGGLGMSFLYDLGARVALQITAALAVFPSAQDRLDRDHAYPADRSPSLPTALQGGANVGLLFFP